MAIIGDMDDVLRKRPAARLRGAQTPHVAPRVAFQTIVGFWVFYFVLNTIHMAFASEPDQFIMLFRRGAVILVGICLTFAMYLILRRLESRSMRFMVGTAFLISIPASLAYACVNYTAFYLVAPSNSIMQELAQMQAKHESTLSLLMDSAVSWYFFIVAWDILYVALSYGARVGQAERAAAAYRSQAQAAQLRALRYQINPHFLFNTLNSLSSLVLTGRNKEAEEMITNLAIFFRNSLKSDPMADVTLADEIDMQRLYLAIERIRFPERLKIDIHVPSDLMDVRVPNLILQPLVENAIKHGVAQSIRPVTIAIRADSRNGSVHLVVEDDADSKATASSSEGVGLRNVRERLLARFDGSANALFGRRDGGGFRAELTIPA